MTHSQIIRAAEGRSPWIGMDHAFLTVSERRSRLPGRGDRLLLILAYSFIVLALCLLITDFCRVMLQVQLDPDLVSRRPAVESAAPARNAHPAHHFSKHA